MAYDHKGDIRDRLPKAPKKNGKKIALIGAGPASLTVARDLVTLGYELVLFEKDPQAGGLMRTNIPAFRLPVEVLDEEVNPMVAAHGGVVSLLEIKDQNVYLEFGGGCQGCGMIDVTLKQGVEVMIKEQVPEIEAIYDVTDHAGGENPYYQPSEK